MSVSVNVSFMYLPTKIPRTEKYITTRAIKGGCHSINMAALPSNCEYKRNYRWEVQIQC